MANLKPSILANSYVKFVRTNNALWSSLTKKDADTLYFIVEDGASKGSLYLGNALIATSLDEGMRLEELLNVVIDPTALTNNDILVYDGANWVSQSIYDFASPTMTGASATQDGMGGLVPAPLAGQQDLFLKGDGTWVDPTVELASKVQTLDTQLTQTMSNLTTVIGGDPGMTMRDVAEDVTDTAIAALVNKAPEAFDTLKEIADWITGDHEGSMDAADLITAVNALNETVNDENTGLVQKVATLERTTSGLSTSVSNLVTAVGDADYGLIHDVAVNTENIDLNNKEILKLWDALKWNELVEDTTTT